MPPALRLTNGIYLQVKIGNAARKVLQSAGNVLISNNAEGVSFAAKPLKRQISTELPKLLASIPKSIHNMNARQGSVYLRVPKEHREFNAGSNSRGSIVGHCAEKSLVLLWAKSLSHFCVTR